MYGTLINLIRLKRFYVLSMLLLPYDFFHVMDRLPKSIAAAILTSKDRVVFVG